VIHRWKPVCRISQCNAQGRVLSFEYIIYIHGTVNNHLDALFSDLADIWEIKLCLGPVS
jgi:hypothetical protein